MVAGGWRTGPSPRSFVVHGCQGFAVRLRRGQRREVVCFGSRLGAGFQRDARAAVPREHNSRSAGPDQHRRHRSSAQDDDRAGQRGRQRRDQGDALRGPARRGHGGQGDDHRLLRGAALAPNAAGRRVEHADGDPSVRPWVTRAWALLLQRADRRQGDGQDIVPGDAFPAATTRYRPRTWQAPPCAGRWRCCW